MTNFTLISGTSRNLDVTLVDNSTPPVAIDLTLADNIVFEVTDGNRVIIQKDIDDGAIVVTDAVNGELVIALDPDDTSPAFGVGSTVETIEYAHEMRLYFTDGTQEVPSSFTGTFTVTPTTTWGSEVAVTAGADRSVIVQGRY